MKIRRKPVIFTCLSMFAACATLIDGAAAQTTGLAGKFVMPGIINLHGLAGNTVDLAQDPRNFTGENAERQLRIYASSGVTSVGSMGSEQPLIMDIRARQRAAARPTLRPAAASPGQADIPLPPRGGRAYPMKCRSSKTLFAISRSTARGSR